MTQTPIPDPRTQSPASYRVELDAYSGPLDLLLYLVKRHEIDLHDIPIARLTEQYLEHVRRMQSTPGSATLDVELAGEFLVMAATLLEIKSQMIIPPSPPVEGEAPEQAVDASGLSTMDPRYELVRQLLAYKRFKDAAGELDHRFEQWQARFPAAPKRPAEQDQAAPAEVDLEDVSVLDLCQAFGRILDSIGKVAAHEVTYDDTPIELHAQDIVDRLQREAPPGTAGMSLQAFFEGRANRGELVGLFLATLELVRQRRIRVVQDRTAGQIRLILVSDQELAAIVEQEDQLADWRDPETGQVQYDWPDPEAKQRAQARARRRADQLARLRRGEAVEPDEEDESVEIDAVDEIDRKLRAIREDGSAPPPEGPA